MNKCSLARQKEDCFWWSCAIVRTIVTNNLIDWKPIYVTKLCIRQGTKCMVARTVLHFPKAQTHVCFSLRRIHRFCWLQIRYDFFPRYYDSLFTQYGGKGDAFLNKTPKCLYLNYWLNDEIFRQIHIRCWNVVPTLIQMYVTVLLFTVEELWKLEGFRVQLDVNWTDIRSLQARHVL